MIIISLFLVALRTTQCKSNEWILNSLFVGICCLFCVVRQANFKSKAESKNLHLKCFLEKYGFVWFRLRMFMNRAAAAQQNKLKALNNGKERQR